MRAMPGVARRRDAARRLFADMRHAAARAPSAAAALALPPPMPLAFAFSDIAADDAAAMPRASLMSEHAGRRCRRDAMPLVMRLRLFTPDSAYCRYATLLLPLRAATLLSFLRIIAFSMPIDCRYAISSPAFDAEAADTPS
jgi:hypothetical protein